MMCLPPWGRLTCPKPASVGVQVDVSCYVTRKRGVLVGGTLFSGAHRRFKGGNSPVLATLEPGLPLVWGLLSGDSR